MITDERVLKEDFVPGEVAHRHDEISVLATAINPVVDGLRPRTCLVTGPSGVGKTCISKFVARQAADRTGPGPFWTAVDGWASRRDVLAAVCREIDPTNLGALSTLSTGQLADQIDEYTEDHPFLVIVDEADQLHDDLVLQELYEVGAGLILTGNREEELLADLDSRVKSRLGSPEHVRMDRYSTEELTDILGARVDQGFVPNAIRRDQLERIADAAAGDARSGIWMLRNVARIAIDAGRSTVLDEDVDRAIDRAGPGVTRELLDRLSGHHRVLAEIVAAAGNEAPMGDIYEPYDERVDDARSKKTVRRYLQKLEAYGAITIHGETSGRTYEPTDALLADFGRGSDIVDSTP